MKILHMEISNCEQCPFGEWSMEWEEFSGGLH